MLIVFGLGLAAFLYLNDSSSRNNIQKLTQNSNEHLKGSLMRDTSSRVQEKDQKTVSIEDEKDSYSDRKVANSKQSSDNSNTKKLKTRNSKNKTDQIIKSTTVNGEQKKVLLPDGSIVFMNENSSISYRKSWEKANKRIVYLSGEAYFDVKEKLYNWKNVKFEVVTNELSVKVIGTQFDIRERDTKSRVYLNSGKINLNIPGLNKNIKMNPGDVVEYDQSTGRVRNKEGDKEQFVS